MTRTIAIIAAFDTKGTEARYIESIISKRGHRSLTIDVGVIADPQIAADISAREVAEAGGGELTELRSRGDKPRAMEVMTHGAATIATKLYASKRFEAIIGLGGT